MTQTYGGVDFPDLPATADDWWLRHRREWATRAADATGNPLVDAAVRGAISGAAIGVQPAPWWDAVQARNEAAAAEAADRAAAAAYLRGEGRPWSGGGTYQPTQPMPPELTQPAVATRYEFPTYTEPPIEPRYQFPTTSAEPPTLPAYSGGGTYRPVPPSWADFRRNKVTPTPPALPPTGGGIAIPTPGVPLGLLNIAPSITAIGRGIYDTFAASPAARAAGGMTRLPVAAALPTAAAVLVPAAGHAASSMALPTYRSPLSALDIATALPSQVLSTIGQKLTETGIPQAAGTFFEQPIPTAALSLVGSALTAISQPFIRVTERAAAGVYTAMPEAEKELIGRIGATPWDQGKAALIRQWLFDPQWANTIPEDEYLDVRYGALRDAVIAQPGNKALLDRLLYRATPEEVEVYRREVAPLIQFGVGAFFDPLIAMGLVTGPLGEMYKIGKAQVWARPAIKIINGVARDVTDVETMTTAGHATSVAGRIVEKLVPTMKLTPRSQVESLAKETTDVVTRLNQAAQQIDMAPAEFLSRFARNPLDEQIVAATGGFSRSYPARRAALVLRKAFGEVTPELVSVGEQRVAAAAKRLAQMEETAAKTAAKADEIAKAELGAAARKAANGKPIVDQTELTAVKAEQRAAALEQRAAEWATQPKKMPAQVAKAAQDATNARRAAEIAREKATNAAARYAVPTAAPETPRLAAARAAAKEAQDGITKARKIVDDLKIAAPKMGDPGTDRLEKLIAKYTSGEKTIDEYGFLGDMQDMYEDAGIAFFGKVKKTMVDGKEVVTYALPTSFPIKVRDTLNGWASIAILGNNPGYAVRNLVSNIEHMIVDGINPFHSMDWRRKLWTDWGVMPIAVGQGMGAANYARQGAKAQSFFREPTRYRDAFKGLDWDPRHAPTAQLSANWERGASQKIIEDQIAHFWPQVWPKTVARFREQLAAGGISNEWLDVWEASINPAMNAKQIWARTEAFLGGAPPTGLVGMPSPVRPGTPLAPAGMPAHVPTEIAQAAQMVDPGLAAHIEEVVTRAPTPAARAVGVEVAKQLNEHAGAIVGVVDGFHALAQVTADSIQSAADLVAHMGQRRALVAEAIRFDDVLMKALHDTGVTSLPRPYRRYLWQVADESRAINRRELDAALLNFDATLDRLGFSPEGIAHLAKGQRDYMAVQDARTALWRKYYADFDAGLQPSYDATVEQVRRLWDEFFPKSDLTQAQISADITAAFANLQADRVRIGRATDEPFTPALVAQAPPRPPTEPPAAAAAPESVAPKPPAPAPAGAAPLPAEPSITIAPPVPASPTKQEIITAAYEAKLPTAGKSGQPVDKAILNFARKYVDPTITNLDTLTDVQRVKLLDELHQRPARLAQDAVDKAARQTAAREALAAAPPPTTAGAAIQTADIQLDPVRLQYKLAVDTTTGAGKSLANVKTWNPALGSGISVWVDPANSKTYVVNGHNRVALAKRLGVAQIEAPYYIQAQTAGEARLVGAVQNIASGRGTPIDAAKVFRESGFTMDVLDQYGLSLSEGTVRQGMALASLNDTLFAAVVRRELPLERAVIIGERVPDADLQMRLVREIDKQMQRGKHVTDTMVAELADMLTGGPQTTVTQETLFGIEEVTQAFAFEKADFYAYVREKLGRDKRIFGAAAKNAEELKRVGEINAAAASGISDAAAQNIALFDVLKNQRGPISDIGNEAAQALAKGGNTNVLKDQYYKRITDALPDAIARRQGDLAAGNIAGVGVRGPVGGQGDGQAVLFGAEPVPAAAPTVEGGLFGTPMEVPRVESVAPVASVPALGTLLDRVKAALADESGAVSVGQAARFWLPFSRSEQTKAITRGARPVLDALGDWLRGIEGKTLPILTAEQAALVRRVVRQDLLPALVKDKAIVAKIATDSRNFALGDYAKRRYLHEWLAFVAPWSYWYTFTWKNWSQRILMQPAFLSNYLRYKSALKQANLAWYQAHINPNAKELPPGLESAWIIDVPFRDAPIMVQFENMLNPLSALTNVTIKTPALDAHPLGNLFKKLGSFGMSWSPILQIGLQKYLWETGAPDAARELGGYYTSISRLLKNVTAGVREAVPATGAVIPPGGYTPEMSIFPWSQGGDYWDQRRIPTALTDLLKSGQISQAEYEAAGFKHEGAVWDAAAQGAALKRLAPSLISFIGGPPFKPYDITDVEIEKMWTAYYAHKADLKVHKGVYTQDQIDEKWLAFETLYPWYPVYMLARETNPRDRLGSYTDLILRRLPPGTRGYALKEEAGLPPELMSKFYDARAAADYSLSKFTPRELATLQEGIEKLTGILGTITPDQKAEFNQAKSIARQLNQVAADAAGTTLDGWYAMQDAYYAEKDKSEKNGTLYLLAHPQLKTGWAAKDKAAATAGPLYQKYYGEQAGSAAGTKIGGISTVGQVTPEMQQAADEDELFKANWQARFGPDVLDWWGKYGEGTAAQKLAIKSDKALWARMMGYLNYRDEFAASHPVWARLVRGATTTSTASGAGTTASISTGARSYGYGGGRSYGGGGGGAVTPPALPSAPSVPTVPSVPGASLRSLRLTEVNAALAFMREQNPQLDTLIGKLFGGGLLSALLAFLALSDADRAKWLADPANAQLAAQLESFMAWFAGLQAQPAGTTSTIAGSIPIGTPTPPVLPGFVSPAPAVNAAPGSVV